MLKELYRERGEKTKIELRFHPFGITIHGKIPIRENSGIYPVNSIVGILLIILFGACSKQSIQNKIAFYHWQSQLQLSDFEKEYLKEINAQKLYVKYFDVDWDVAQKMAIPLALLEVNDWNLDSLEIIPCIFITNRTMLEIAPENIPQLAKNIHIKIEEFNYSFPKNKIQEIQIDCDWTSQSRSNYFQLLEELQKHYPSEMTFSATIRLHQVKYYEKTQVPPVDRGMLMYYNVGDVDKAETSNSILTPKEAKKYLYNFDVYPLELDLALPIFAWGVVIRDGKVIKLINNLERQFLQADERFKEVESNFFEVQKSTYLDGYYLYKNDIIRTEYLDLPPLQEAVTVLKDVWKTDHSTISFYHLDSMSIKNFEPLDLKDIWK